MNNDLAIINNTIDHIRDNIYEYDLKAMYSNLDILVFNLTNKIDLQKLQKEKIDIFNNILGNINISINNKDFQLVADLLKYQLKDFLSSYMKIV